MNSNHRNRKLRIIDKNVLSFVKCCCWVYKLPRESSDYLSNKTYELLVEDDSFKSLLNFQWPDKFFKDFIVLVLKNNIFYNIYVGRYKIDQFFFLTKNNSLEYSMSRLIYAIKENEDVSDIKIDFNTSNPNPNRRSYFLGTPIPKNGATGELYGEMYTDPLKDFKI